MSGGAMVQAWHRHVVGGDDPRPTPSFAVGLGSAVALTPAAGMTDLRSQLSAGVDPAIFEAVGARRHA